VHVGALQCEAVGFPDAQSAGVYNEDRQLTGKLTWAIRGERFNIDVTNAPPARADNWRGFSGAAVFCAGRLTAIVRNYDERFQGRVLEALPVSLLFADKAFCHLIQPFGNARVLLAWDGLVNSGTIWDSSSGQYRPPRLMPYLADRHDQEQRFIIALQHHFDSKIKRPLCFVVHGNELQCVDTFVEQLYYVKLPEVLDANDLGTDVAQHTLQWPDAAALSRLQTDQDLPDRFRDLENQVKTFFGLRINSDETLLGRAVKGRERACFFNASINLADWSAGHARLLRQWLEFWTTMKLNELVYPIVTVVAVVFPSGFLGSMPNAWRIQRLRRDVLKIRHERLSDVVVVELPELKDLRYEDITPWIMSYVHSHDREVVRREIRKRFVGRWKIGRRRLSMYETAAAIKAVLSDPQARIVLT
jgi:hypothetical protein